MYIDELVEYCDSKYNRDGKCTDCLTPHECENSCEKCLEYNHYPERAAERGIKKDYNCPNMINFYVCRYIYKYSSEIEHLLRRMKILENLDVYRILSIGCGPATDLGGFINCLEGMNGKNKFSYLGVDENKLWSPVHQKIKDIIGDKIKLKFLPNDILEIIEKFGKHPWVPNIVVLQYFLSDLEKREKGNVNNFINKLSENILDRMPENSYVIINDINHNIKARDYFEELMKNARNRRKLRSYRFHFENCYTYGYKHGANVLTSKIPIKIKNKYKSWDHCTGAQLVIHFPGR